MTCTLLIHKFIQIQYFPYTFGDWNMQSPYLAWKSIFSKLEYN